MLDMQLTPNFQLSEFLRSETAARKRIANDPTDQIRGNLRRLAQSLEVVRGYFGPVFVSSGYRSPELNKEIGGAETSLHCFGLAVDFNVAKVSPSDVIRWIGENMPKFDEAIDEPGWAHLGLATPDGQQRKRLLTMRPDKSGKAKYTKFV